MGGNMTWHAAVAEAGEAKTDQQVAGDGKTAAARDSSEESEADGEQRAGVGGGELRMGRAGALEGCTTTGSKQPPPPSLVPPAQGAKNKQPVGRQAARHNSTEQQEG